MRQVPRGHTFTPLHEAHMRKTAKDTSRAATLPGGMNTMIKKKLAKAGICVTDDDGVGEQDLHQVRRHVYAGHALRGNAESTLDAVHRLGHVQYDALEHVHRARHTHATYERHYKRVVPARVTTAARQHPQHGELTADEVLFL